MTAGAKLKFPLPEELRPKNPVAFRSQPVIVQLYMQETGDAAEKISKKVRSWVVSTAKSKGWSEVYFPEDYPTKNFAGAVFIKWPTDHT